MKINTTYNMDALEASKILPDQCVDCIVTSPPYFGLRDYGTGTWVGGDPACDHLGEPMRTRVNLDGNSKHGKGVTHEPYKSVCGKCGAIRIDKQIGLEENPEQYIEKLVLLFHELRRVLKDEGTLWVNIGDSYNGYKGNAIKQDAGTDWAGYRDQPTRCAGFGLEYKKLKAKDLIGIPWMLAFALRADGWYLRQDIIWSKPSCVPESVKDRCTKSHEYIFLFSKKAKYYFDYKAIQTETKSEHNAHGRISKKRFPTDKINGIRNTGYYPMANKRSVWHVVPKSFREAHFATYPEELIVDCIKAGCPVGGIVLDPFNGSGTTRIVANKLGRNAIGFELNPEYIKIEERRRIKELGIFNI